MLQKRLRVAAVGAAIGAAFSLGLAGCTGEAEEATPQVDGESSWGTTAPEEADELQTELEAGFPVEAFPVPDDAVIYDNGERGEGQWFLVLQASDETEAEHIWDAVIAGGEFEVSDEEETAEGGVAATLTSDLLLATALTIPFEDGSVLLNYDLEQAY